MEFAAWKELLIKNVESSMQINVDWRYGQTVFNVMCDMGLGNHIRMTELDCFYFKPAQLNEAWWEQIEALYNKRVMA